VTSNKVREEYRQHTKRNNGKHTLLLFPYTAAKPMTYLRQLG
jgi:hypothetical protein